MVRVIDVTLPTDEFVMAAAFDANPALVAEFTAVVPTATAIFPYLHVFDDPDHVARRALERDPHVAAVRRRFETEQSTMYQVWWERGLGIFESLVGTEAAVLSVSGSADGWTFRIGFPSVEGLEAFERRAEREDLTLTVTHASSHPPVDRAGLSPTQLRTLRLALDRGYFDVPRRATLDGLAEELDVSSQAVSQRLRRGTRSLLSTRLPGGIDVTPSSDT